MVIVLISSAVSNVVGRLASSAKYSRVKWAIIAAVEESQGVKLSD